MTFSNVSPNPKPCVTCSKPFVPSSNRQKYCSAECRNGTGVCAGCGETFQKTGTVRDQRFCSTACYYATEARTRNRICEQCGEDCSPGNRFCSYECAHLAAQAARSTRECLRCGSPFIAKVSSDRKFCSRTCSAQYRNISDMTALPEGTVRPHGSGYVMVKVAGGWVMQHRVVMAQILGRPLEAHERVHHRNGDRADNRPENLELWKVKKKDPAGVRADDYHCAGCTCFDDD